MSEHEIEGLRLRLMADLPPRALWAVGPMSLAFSFLALEQPLRLLAEALSLPPETPLEHTRYRVFGEQSYAEGGGASPLLVLSERDGSVAAFDAESTDPLRPLSSSIERFIQSFRAVDTFMSLTNGDVAELRASLAAIDPARFPVSEWCELVDELAHHAEG